MRVGDTINFSSRTRSLAVWLTAALTLAPLVLYAYLGHFSRLMIDDYAHFANALWLGFRDNFNYWRNSWNGSFSFYTFHDLLTPLDPARLPPIFPALTIVLWLTGLAWLISLLLRCLQLRRNHLPFAISLSALTVLASIKSFHTLESIYWYSAIVRHTLPVGGILIYLAFSLEIAARLRSKVEIAAVAMTGALICFINGGFSELNVVIQLVYLPLVLAGICLLTAGPGRRRLFALLAAGWCGSAISLLVQLTAPGLANRMMVSASSISYANTIRELPLLVAETLRSSLEYIGHQGSLLGFTLLLAAGLVAAQLAFTPKQTDKAPRSMSLASPPLLLGIIVQLIFLPILWAHASEHRQVFGGSSYLSMAVLGLNIVSLLGYLLLIWRRSQLEAALNRRLDGAMRLSATIMLGVFALLALTQMEGTHVKVSVYLFASALILLGILASLLDSLAVETLSRRFGLFAILSLVLSAIGVALPLAIGHYGLGYIYVRSLAFSALMQVIPGLVWGAYIGYLIQRGRVLTRSDPAMIRRFKTMGMLIIFGIAIVCMAAQLQLVPDFATFAREWDARHELVIQSRDRGVRNIEVAPYSFDLSGYISASGQAFGESNPYYYRVESIVVVES